MQSILFIVHPAKGPINASFQLAHRFKERGYVIFYLVPPDLKGFIAQQRHAVITDPIDEYQPDIFAEEIIRKNNVALVIIDVDQLSAAIILYKIPVGKIMINTTFLADKAYLIPTFFSSTLPSRTWLSFLRIEWEWTKWFIRKGILYRTRLLISRGTDDMYKKRLAARIGFPLKKFANFSRTWLYGLDNYPEFILYPPELDFPRYTPGANKYFAGPFIFIDRTEENFDWGKIDLSLPVLYCSLGTIASRYFPKYIRFYETLITAFGRRRDINLILAAGDFYDRLISREIPGNIFVYRSVPQLQVLQKAQIMITHGGANSVKECIRFGVPMMVYPLRGIHDSGGNAARVVYHNLGRRGNALSDPPGKVVADIDCVRQNRTIKENILQMRSAFLRHESNEGYIIDDMLSYAHPTDAHHPKSKQVPEYPEPR